MDVSDGAPNAGVENGKNSVIKIEPTKDIEGWLKVRHIQALMMFFCFFTAIFLRINLSVGIVAMTNKNSSNPNFEEFDWDEPTKSKLLSGFFWGYLVTQLPAGVLGQQFSPKMLLVAANAACAILALLIPFAATYVGWVPVFLIRVCQGLSQGFYVPLSYNLASKWAPPGERNRFVGFSLNGGTLGATAALITSGILASSSWGWPSIFYVSGVIGLLWTIVWFFVGGDSPEKHTHITQQERQYIQESLKQSAKAVVYTTPWKAIFTSIPMWALIGAHIGNGWGVAIIMTELPSYIHSVLGFDISVNGLLSALPCLSMWVFTFPICWLADEINKRKLLPLITSRKLWTTISQGGGAVMVLGLCFVDRNAVAAMTLITISVTLSACIFSGFNINHLDLAPNFAGVLMGLSNGLENISTILAPLSVGWLITDPTSVADWRLVFITTAIVTLLGNLIFVVYGSADTQPWNNPENNKKTENSNKTHSRYSNLLSAKDDI